MILTALPKEGIAQKNLGLIMPPNVDKVTIPFSFVNNLIVIPITINNQITIKFILDTGANNPILTEKIFGDIMGLDYSREINIAGVGAINVLNAHVASDVRLRFPQGIRGRYISMLVLEEDYIQLKKNLGEDVYGIIGFDVFSRFVVELDFDKFEMTLHRPRSFKPSRNYDRFDLSIEDSKPFLQTVVEQGEDTDTLKFMIDTGASHALLIDLTQSEVLTLPDTTLESALGHGLGGEIYGRVGRIDAVKIGDFELKDVLVSIPDQGAYNASIKRGSRNGTIGGQILYHFNVVFDYHREAIYLDKNGNYRNPFQYDMSGLRVSYFENPKRYQITGIMEKSPASKTPIEVGDEVLYINGHHIDNSKLSDINALLRSRPNRKIRITVLKNDGERVNCKFRLKSMI